MAFSLDLAEKDLRLITALADALGVADAAGRRPTSPSIRAASTDGRGGHDFSTVAQRAPRAAGRPAAGRARQQGRSALTDERPRGAAEPHAPAPRRHR